MSNADAETILRGGMVMAMATVTIRVITRGQDLPLDADHHHPDGTTMNLTIIIVGHLLHHATARRPSEALGET